MEFPQDTIEKLNAIYEDMMWLAKRPHNTSRQARAWYSQVLSSSLARRVRRFTGKVSRSAIKNLDGPLVLEHYRRSSYELSSLIEMHITGGVDKPEEFLKLITKCERVNITTNKENQIIQKNKGDYKAAGIELVNWSGIDLATQNILWKSKLKGKVCNDSA